MASLRKGHHRRVANKTLSSKARSQVLYNRRRSAPLALTKVELSDALARSRNRAMRNSTIENEEIDEGDEEDIEEHDEYIRPSELNEEVTEASQLVKKLRKQLGKDERTQMIRLKRDVEKYYQDPLQLASAVVQKLKVPDIDGALGLVRASEAFKVNNIVSWNHCMDWLMSQGDIKTALKVYNEVKKRGHMPDAHTYTIMLAGLGQNAKKPTAVQEAIKMYNSMSAPNSLVRPNIIHTNAIINVCARAGDMDTLWGVTSKLPERGPGCPNRTTYTTILNALRENTIRKAAEIANKAQRLPNPRDAQKERLAMFAEALDHGRKLWVDISYRWRRADLVIDEQLVCAMGRLILGCGVGNDHEQVFDLVETSMNIRIPERKGRRSHESRSQEVEGEFNPKTDADQRTEQGLSNPSKLPLKESTVYATPSNNTLSMLLEAALLYKSRADIGKSYWYHLTNPEGRFRVEPDAANIISYLRILRRTHSSHEVYDLLSREWSDDIAKNLYRRSTFIIAFAACARDKLNPNVFETARKLLKLSEAKLEEKAVGMFDESVALSEMHGKQRKKVFQSQKAELKTLDEDELADHHRSKDGVQSMPNDPKILRYFVDLAVDTTKGWNEGIRGVDVGEVFERSPDKNHTMIALRIVGPTLPTLVSLLKAKLEEMQYDDLKKQRKRSSDVGSQVGEKTEELIALLRSMIAAYDKVLAVADRFEKTKREPIDPSRRALYDKSKRQVYFYMSRIESTLRKKLREEAALGDEKDLETEQNENAEDENEIPDIERRIQAVLESVDGKATGYDSGQLDGTRKFGFKKFPVEGTQASMVGKGSRRQKRARENLVEAAIKREFGEHDHGVLNEELEIESQKQAEAGIRRKKSPGSFTGRASMKRQPMIGDELGLEDNEDHVPFTREKPYEPSKKKDEGYIPFEAAGKHPPSSILENEQVRSIWGRSSTAAAG